MKLFEFRNIIREEIRNVLTEVTDQYSYMFVLNGAAVKGKRGNKYELIQGPQQVEMFNASKGSVTPGGEPLSSPVAIQPVMDPYSSSNEESVHLVVVATPKTFQQTLNQHMKSGSKTLKTFANYTCDVSISSEEVLNLNKQVIRAFGRGLSARVLRMKKAVGLEWDNVNKVVKKIKR